MKQFIFTSFLVLLGCTTYCQPGTVDPSFGNKGFVETEASETNFFSTGRASALQTDGKILVGGQQYAINAMRYLPNGITDSSFGKNGIATVTGLSGFMAGIAVQQDGKIIIAINNSGSTAAGDIITARLMPNGSIDTEYGLNGVSGVDFGDNASIDAIALQPDGKLLLAGGASTDPQAIIHDYGIIIRLNTDGSLDKTFGKNGRTENTAANDFTSLALQRDGKVLAAGSQAFGFNFFSDYVVSRSYTDGSPDNTFGINGNVTTDGLGSFDEAQSVLVQVDGKVVVSGYSATPSGYAMSALRYTPQGVLDETFGTGGKTYVSFEDHESKSYQALLQEDGKIILTGAVYSANAKNSADFALCRLGTDGSPDSSFAIDGRQVTVATPRGEISQSSLLQPNGKIILAGYGEGEDGNTHTNLLVRYNGDEERKPLIVRIKRWLHNHGIGWQGIGSTGISYYSVQYSKTGKGFIEKEKVNGIGSSAFQQYGFNVLDEGYYRVVAVDQEGYKIFSNLVLITNADISVSTSVFPNPARSYVTIQGLSSGETTSISIKDGSGNVLARGISKGSVQYRSQLGSNMQPGTYYINVSTAQKTETLKFVKE